MYRKDKPSSVKRRNDARNSQTRSRKLEGKISFSGKTEEELADVYKQVTAVKSYLGQGNASNTSNSAMLKEVFLFYMAHHGIEAETADVQKPAAGPSTSSFCGSNVEDTEQDMFLTTPSAIISLVSKVQEHGRECDSNLGISNTQLLGHVGRCELSCPQRHQVVWVSSAYLGDKFLCNLRIAHGFMVSGILQNQYRRVVQAANMGELGDAYMATVGQEYRPVVATLAAESCKAALREEEVLSGGSSVDILTDARHGTRKNSQHTDVVCLGARTHKVLRVEHVTRTECNSAQKHELIGTRRVYQYLDGMGAQVKVHCHDRNTSVNKFIHDERRPTVSTNDTWHATKNIAKELKNVCRGPKYKEGKTWHHQLSDKAASIKTHIYWAMKNCDGDPEKLREIIMNVVPHYSYRHEGCHSTSRCKSDAQYEPSKVQLTDPVAIDLLQSALRSTQVYRTPQDYVHCMDTYYVESFNNALLQYHDKRINFSNDVYELRTNFAVLDWNEHVGRPATSTRTVRDEVNAPRRQSGTRVLQKQSRRSVAGGRQLSQPHYTLSEWRSKVLVGETTCTSPGSQRV